MDEAALSGVARRPPSQVMRLARMGSFHQCRLSFMRQLTRRLASENWQFSQEVFDIGPDGVGHAVYVAQGPVRAYSLVAFAHDLPAEKRSDRVIAEAWDATFALVDGIPTPEDITRLGANVPRQEAGRISERELCLSRANRSVRLWDHVVAALADGRQPDPDLIDAAGYLMRTTAVYGSGKFGAADREVIADRPEMQAPFQAEMLTVYLIRTFVRDLVNHMAQARGGAGAVRLDSCIAQGLGIGNSTGLGMAPFLVNHPVLLNNWIIAREEAIARVRAVAKASTPERDLFLDVLARVHADLAQWRSAHPIQVEKVASLQADLTLARRQVTGLLAADHPWDRLMGCAEAHLSLEGQECLASLMLEPYPDLVDGLAACMSDSNVAARRIDGAMTVAQVRALLHGSFGWAFEQDWTAQAAQARVWYVSEEKLEPRLGERFEEPVSAYEQPLAPARDAARAEACLARWAQDAPVADVLMRHPEHRHTIRRAQMARVAPYGEIRDNTIAADMLPIDMLRAKLSFFGATRFDPRSDRWVRICMYAGAPYPEELAQANADRWIYPLVPE